MRADFQGGTLCLTVDNTCTKAPKRTAGGDLLSTKHKGVGLGTRSVKDIAARYHGVCRLEAKDGMFYASVLCQPHAAPAEG